MIKMMTVPINHLSKVAPNGLDERLVAGGIEKHLDGRRNTFGTKSYWDKNHGVLWNVEALPIM